MSREDPLARMRTYEELYPTDEDPWSPTARLRTLDDTCPPAESTIDRFSTSRIDWGRFWTTQDETDWLVEPFIARGRAHALYAPPKLGKSLLLLEMSAALATGRAALDQPAGPIIRVLYVDEEMTEDDVRERLVDLGYGDADDLEALAYYVLPALPPLDTREGGATLVELATAHRADLVVIDTLGRVVQGAENEADTIRSFYRHCGSRLKALGMTVVRLDHAGKDLERGQRGSSAKADDVDVVWFLTARDAGRLTLRATHRRMNWLPETIELERLTDPLRHRRVIGSWPAGTKALATVLDDLGLLPDAGRIAARTALKEAGHGARNETLAAALNYRRGQ